MPRLQQPDTSGTMSCTLRTPGLREGDCPSEPLASPGRLVPRFNAWVWSCDWFNEGIYTVMSACVGDVGMFFCYFQDTVNVV